MPCRVMHACHAMPCVWCLCTHLWRSRHSSAHTVQASVASLSDGGQRAGSSGSSVLCGNHRPSLQRQCDSLAMLRGAAGSPVPLRHFAPRKRCRGAPVNNPCPYASKAPMALTVMSALVWEKRNPKLRPRPHPPRIRASGLVGMPLARERYWPWCTCCLCSRPRPRPTGICLSGRRDFASAHTRLGRGMEV